ncbi:pyridoxamine 5'-phosphate oxidase family protein [Pelagicoccus sp. SDUM812003]|uniref:pyridoxamine 5'-phosphate oxidase family protein n=1 Tax=Pelagicoccus sp. SDUM812003 TaxID=3041267 RepID=UPI00280FC4A3|nr:pyridoxamine 5'-phosphate oxidase family protein [Pelagicoccus sp. SDUM812003]MDQ8204816.1 pyridoxamine 5'-phosphate oxidase family protein [Pelagicoccus sp. SDUM812003]
MKLHPEITPKLARWIEQQKLFFVGSAPLSADGHINLSPKGGDCFRILGPKEVAYLDYTGSGAETIAHLRENGRIVIMFCAFEGGPQIVRLHGTGTAHLPSDDSFQSLASRFPSNPGMRSIIRIEVQRVSDSCGYSVPYFDYQGERDILDKWANAKGREGVTAYQAEKNRLSIDGLPALEQPSERT